jgi:hypothetical protein
MLVQSSNNNNSSSSSQEQQQQSVGQAAAAPAAVGGVSPVCTRMHKAAVALSLYSSSMYQPLEALPEIPETLSHLLSHSLGTTCLFR